MAEINHSYSWFERPQKCQMVSHYQAVHKETKSSGIFELNSGHQNITEQTYYNLSTIYHGC